MGHVNSVRDYRYKPLINDHLLLCSKTQINGKIKVIVSSVLYYNLFDYEFV